jgi:aspartate/methionine/tyrosine aminotransferase
MVDVRDYGSSMDVAEKLLDFGVVTIPGSAFGSQSEGFLRVSFCADLPVLEEGVKRIAAGLKSRISNV